MLAGQVVNCIQLHGNSATCTVFTQGRQMAWAKQPPRTWKLWPTLSGAVHGWSGRCAVHVICTSKLESAILFEKTAANQELP